MSIQRALLAASTVSWLAVSVFAAENAVPVAPTAAPATATAPSGPLDGRSYEVKMTGPDGKTADNTLTFSGGTVESSACKTMGYGPAAYTASEAGGKIHAMADMKNEKGGLHKLHAQIEGDKISGSMETTDEGKTVGFKFEGSLKK